MNDDRNHDDRNHDDSNYDDYDKPKAESSGLAIGAFILALVGFLLGWFPFLGWIGTVGMIMGIVALRSRGKGGAVQKKGLAIAAVTLGSMATLAAAFWLVVTMTLASSSRRSSCPHLYTHNGDGYVLDADPLSGSLFRGAERTDFDRLEELAAVDGEYRLKLINERDERDFVDALALLWVDHPKGTEVLPTGSGKLLQLAQAAAPLRAKDGRGRDIRAQLLLADDTRFSSRLGDFTVAETKPREEITLTFARPQLAAGESTSLILRARNTEFGAEAFARYLAQMGPGLSKLLQWAQDSDDYPYKTRLADEMKRLGLLLEVEVWDGQSWQLVFEQEPIGPAVLRSVAIPLPPFTSASDSLRIRIRHAPLLWTVDRAAVARSTAVVAQELRAKSSAVSAAEIGRLASVDQERLRLLRGESLELRFAVPPAAAEALRRTVVLKIRGYYEIEVGGKGLLNLLPLWRHRADEDSFVHFALELARKDESLLDADVR